MAGTRSVTWFLIVTFAATWLIELGMILAGGMNNPRAFQLGGAAVMLVPMVAAILIRKVFREGFNNAGLRWRGGRYYALAFGLSLLWVGLAYGLTWVSDLGPFDASMPRLTAQARAALTEMPPEKADQALQRVEGLRWWVLGLAISIGPLINLPFAFGEEFGWRGFLLPRLLPLGTFRALLLTGIIWGIWHAPVILMGWNYPGHEAVGVPMMVLWCIPLGFFFGWLFLRSGSVFVPSLAHSCLNAFASGLLLLTADMDPRVGGAAGIVGIGLVLLLAAVLWVGFPVQGCSEQRLFPEPKGRAEPIFGPACQERAR